VVSCEVPVLNLLFQQPPRSPQPPSVWGLEFATDLTELLIALSTETSEADGIGNTCLQELRPHADCDVTKASVKRVCSAHCVELGALKTYSDNEVIGFCRFT
jgi:hypothetical protein